MSDPGLDIIQIIVQAFAGLPKELAVFLIAMLPIAELRLAIPLGMTVYGMKAGQAMLWATLGNIAAVLPVLFLYELVAGFLSCHSLRARRFFIWLFERTRHRHSETFLQYGALALVVFVGIPIPGTGGWTGAVAAFVFGIDKFKAFLLISLGIVLAALIVTLITIGGINGIKAL